MNLNDVALGAYYAPHFLAAMVQEGGRVESEHGLALPLSDWIYTYINL